ncbi:MFS transporter [Saccharothrix longispora]|uniref:MFS family arabinose efflux permease n=1 Tax=Saccharothrix longispora TaxID=33920 RepID=A0ABU1PRH6_9PSEU|nr:MFS transporter [Saccharothrix longispora]MDR6593252.1 putative MFS family arabinose efflux permease [Saccharothrix longispora]
MSVDRSEVPGDLRMARALGPVLVASAVLLLPFTVFSTFLVPIAETTGGGVAVVGGLRGLGGLAALVVGAALAPLLDRVPRLRAAAGGLVLLAVGSLIGAIAEFAAVVVFCLVIGAAMAVLGPALGAAAADRFDGPAAGRAATLVTATQSLTAMLAAPVVALPALLWGWRGDLVAIAVVAVVLAAVLARLPAAPAPAPERVGYLAAFRALAHVRPLLAAALLRTAAFMGYLSYLAAFYDERFDLAPGPFALVWTLSGTSFFLGNLLSGRYVGAGRVGARPVLLSALACALVAVVAIFHVHALVLALVLTAVLGASHATAAACLVTLLVDRAGTSRGAALGVHGAAMSVGTFAGAAAGGVGLGVAGFTGAAVAFGVLTAAAVVVALRLS